ncbi:MAG: TlpA family protein disulfide reductase [Flavobacteriaceae bacterium]
MKLNHLCILFCLALFNCVDDDKTAQSSDAYFGGEIINPNNDFVVISKADKIIDSVKLDKRNRFLYKFENIEQGLYTFHHGGEIQIVLLEPADSLLFRLNTLEFDESLVYTGVGAKKNNYLINEFLENEILEKNIFKFCQLAPELYVKRIDSLKHLKIQKLNTFKNKYETSSLFDKIAQANINFNYYSNKEVYPFVHYGKDKGEFLKTLPDNFYDYRKKVDYNDAFFKDHHYYNTFLRHSFNTLALKKHAHSQNKKHTKGALCYHLDKLNLVDSLVSNPTIKNDLLRYYTLNYLSKSTDVEANDQLLNSFLSKSSDIESKNELKRFATAIANIRSGAKFPEIALINHSGNEVEINKLLKKPTVITFWSHVFYDHFKESQYLLGTLRKKYPDVHFITINIDNYGIDKVKKSLVSNRFALDNQYVFKNPEITKEFLAIQPMTKTILIDKHKKVINSNANIFSVNFEEQVLGLINR